MSLTVRQASLLRFVTRMIFGLQLHRQLFSFFVCLHQ